MKANKYLYITIFSLIIIFCSFSYGIKLKVNGQKKYTVGCNNSLVEFKATSNVTGWSYTIIIKSKKGDIDFYSDSLKIITHPVTKSNSTSFRYDRKEFNGHQVIKKGKTVLCYFILHDFEFPNDINVDKIYILPTNYIMCDGEPLIKDTIVIDRKLSKYREK